MWPLVVVTLDEVVEAFLLLKEIVASAFRRCLTRVVVHRLGELAIDVCLHNLPYRIIVLARFVQFSNGF